MAARRSYNRAFKEEAVRLAEKSGTAVQGFISQLKRPKSLAAVLTSSGS